MFYKIHFHEITPIFVCFWNLFSKCLKVDLTISLDKNKFLSKRGIYVSKINEIFHCKMWSLEITFHTFINSKQDWKKFHTNFTFSKICDRIQITDDYSKTCTINRKIIHTRYFIKELFCIMKSYTIIYILYTYLSIDIK